MARKISMTKNTAQHPNPGKKQKKSNAASASALQPADPHPLEEQLLASQSLLAEAERVGSMGCVEWVAGREELVCSEGFLRLFELPNGESIISRKTLAKRIHPEDLPFLEAMDQKAFAERTDIDYEYRLLLPGGKMRWVRQQGRMIYDDKTGKPVRMIGVFRDVSDRKAMEEALHESKERYRGLFEDSPIALWEEDFSAVKAYIDRLRVHGVTDFRTYFQEHPQAVLDCTTLVKILDVNKASLSMMGAQRKEDLLTNLGQLISEDGLQAFKEELINIAEGRTKFTWTGINHTLDGRVIDVLLNWSAAPGHEHDLARVLISIIDVSEANRVKAELTESQARLELFFAQSMDGFFFMMLDEPIEWNDKVDKDKTLEYVFDHQRITKANDAILAQYGAKPGQYLGQTPRIFFAHDIEYGKKIWREFFDKGHLHVDTDERKLDGTPMWIEGDYICLYDSKGRIVGHFGIQREITDRKRIEEKLRLQSAALEASANAIVIANRTGAIQWANPAFTALTGYAVPEEVFGRNPRDLVKSGKQDQAFYANLWNTILSGQVWHGELINRRKDWTLYEEEMTITPVHDRNGEVTHFIAVKQDISERKQFERALRESEEEYKRLINLLPSGVIIHNMGKTVFINRTAARLFGAQDPQELIGGQLIELVHPDYRQVVSERVAQIMEHQGEAPLLDEKLIRLDGSVFDAEVAAMPVEFNGESCILVLFNDISVRVEAEEKINQLNLELEQRVEERTRELRETQEQLVRQQKLAALGQLAGSVGHELRNPLAVINGAAYYLKLAQPNAEPKVKEYLTMIERETFRAEKIITDLLDFSRIKNLDPEPASILEAVERALARFPAPENVTVSLRFPPALPRAYADAHHMEQVFGNLILNAIQAMPEGGQLTVTGTPETADGKPWLRVEVADTGVGIPPENMSKLFEPLFTTKIRGIGLGLAVCQKLVQANGGRIEVQSEAGRGSVFTVWLPVYLPDISKKGVTNE